MSMSDPIADMLTRIRNGQTANKENVSFSTSKKKTAVLQVLTDEGYIDSFDSAKNGNKSETTVILKYYHGKPVISTLKRISRPGLRIFKGKDELPNVMSGLGIAIISTSNGVMSDQLARVNGVGGEVLCIVE